MSLRYHKTVLADNVNLVAEGSDGSVHLDHLGNMFAIAVNVHHIMALAASSMAGPPAHSRSGFMRASFRLSDLHDCTGNTTSFLTPSEWRTLTRKWSENSDPAKTVWAYFICTGISCFITTFTPLLWYAAETVHFHCIPDRGVCRVRS